MVPAGSSRKTSITCNFFRFLLSKSDGFLIFNGASQKFAIFSENLDFWVPPRNFSSNQGGQSIRQTKGYPTRALIFSLFFPPFYQEMPIYGSKHGFWTWNQHLWTLKCLETKIHPTSPRHLYSKRDIGIFYFLIIIKGCLYNTCVCVCLVYFWTVCEALFLLFFKTFLGHRQIYDFVSLVFRFCSVFSIVGLISLFEHAFIEWYHSFLSLIHISEPTRPY